MDNQQNQNSQNLNQNMGEDSEFVEADDESNFDEVMAEIKEVETLQKTEQDKPVSDEKPKKLKRPRRTIEQKLADLDAKRQRLMEKKRSQDAHEKIVFGSTVIAMLKDMKERNDKNGPIICKTILAFTMAEQPKNEEIISKIIEQILK